MPEVVGITVHLTFARGERSRLPGGTGTVGARSFWADCTCFRVPKSAPRMRMRSR